MPISRNWRPGGVDWPRSSRKRRTLPWRAKPRGGPAGANKIDLNTCTLEQLQNLPGVGAAMGAHIMAGRPYRNFDDLARDGVPLSTIEQIRGAGRPSAPSDRGQNVSRAASVRGYNGGEKSYPSLGDENPTMSESNASDVNYESLPRGHGDGRNRRQPARLTSAACRKRSWPNTCRPGPTTQLIAWDDNFRDDGTLFLMCSERDVDIEEYRRVLVEHIRFRFASDRD